MKPPIAHKHPQGLTTHGHSRVDPYYWLRDDSRENAEVLAYLEAENRYTADFLKPTQALQQQLVAELKARIQDEDTGVPVRHGNWHYSWRYSQGQEQPVHFREPVAGGDEQVLLDENALGAEHAYYRVGDYDVGDDDTYLVWTEDVVSRNQFRLRIRNLASGEEVISDIENIAPSIALAADGRTVFYTRLQEETLIPHEVWRHRIGSDQPDERVYVQSDLSFYTEVSRSRDEQYIVIAAHATLSSELHTIPAHNPEQPPRVLLPRMPEHEYEADFSGDWVYLLTNHNAPNFRLVRAHRDDIQHFDRWETVLSHRDDVFLDDFTVVRDFVVVEQTQNANRMLQVMEIRDSGVHAREILKAKSDAFAMELGANPNLNTDILRYTYSDMCTPTEVYDLNLRSGDQVLRKTQFAGTDFDASQYRSHRLQILARDGTALPVSILAGADNQPDGSHPCYLLGYGAYGSWYEPGLMTSMLSLVDRGFVFAIAHIRGGQEMGRAWYDAGRLQHKQHTFTDFIDIANGLKALGWSHPKQLAATGRSAGGLLIGAVANMAPDTFDALVTSVPFVDVVTTMLDESIPLTTFEYDEWGNPNQSDAYQWMLAYSPYDQITPQNYPPIFVSSGLWDSQVQYWEPAKWVAKLRATKTDENPLLLYTDMAAGHSGGSGRYERLSDTARELAFTLHTFKIA